ncbi:GNAT family N-acetyltransferase [Metabacillus sp. Hm71]|uniref:GNAT family N-acetyltransferase n=1 Tax=Metabacillus sp. Hm71 TaxID=3450743 RepID=UPI003F441DA2
MLKKCTSADHDQVMEFLIEEKAFNLFIIGDIENFGYDADFQDIFAQYNKNGEIEGILLRYQHTYIPYTKTKIDLTKMANLISSDPELVMVSGKNEIVKNMQTLTPLKRAKLTYFAELKDNEALQDQPHDFIVKKASLEDVERICVLKEQISEFDFNSSTKQSFKRTIETKSGRTFFIENAKREVISIASTTAENQYSAMIVGVCSHPAERQKGLASVVMQELCKELLAEGKTLCLFYNNPNAGRIYKRLGFNDIGLWRMAYPK